MHRQQCIPLLSISTFQQMNNVEHRYPWQSLKWRKQHVWWPRDEVWTSLDLRVALCHGRACQSRTEEIRGISWGDRMTFYPRKVWWDISYNVILLNVPDYLAILMMECLLDWCLVISLFRLDWTVNYHSVQCSHYICLHLLLQIFLCVSGLTPNVAMLLS